MRSSLFYLLIFLSIRVSAQHISLNDSITLETNKAIIKSIENQFNVKFFYKDAWLQSTSLKKNEKCENLDSLLELTFNQTPLKYYIHQLDKVILTINNDLIVHNEKLTDDLSEDIVYSSIDNQLLSEQIKLEEKRIRKIGTPGSKATRVILTGTVSEIVSGQEIEGVAVYIDDGKIGTATDKNGNYSLVLPQGYHVLHFKHVSMEPTKRLIEIYTGGKINVKLIQKVTEFEEVRILGEDERKQREIVGFEILKPKDLEELPTFMGEVDIIKQSLLLPGIQSNGEADMSFSVRGGKGDQNLILIDGMHTYNHYHFFGFFPNINPTTINKVNLYKGSMPIEFGNRISSVYDLSIKAGDQKQFSVDGNISPISASLAINGPILKDKITFSVAGRSTYSDYVFDNIDLEEFNNSYASFYDYQAKINYLISDNSTISLFYYQSFDNFTLHIDTVYNFYNQLGSLNWKHIYNDQLSFSSMLGFTKYKSQFKNTSDDELSYLKEQSITDWKFNLIAKYNYNQKNTLNSGIEFVYQQLAPWSLYQLGESSTINPIKLNKDNALLGSVFINDNFNYSNRLSFDIGLRYMMFLKIGPDEKYIYSDNHILEKYIVDTVFYSKNEFSQVDHGLDIRISGNYSISHNQNLNFSYNRNNQFIHLLTNSQGVTPVDSWQLSNGNISPQTGNQFSLGYNIDLFDSKYFVSLDGYYKLTKNIKDFINGSEFEYSTHPETEIADGKGLAYGLELLIKKNSGRISGFLSYTYSRSFIKTLNNLPEKTINNGEYYPSSYDKPHNFSAVLNLKPTRRLTLSNIFNYSTGAPITLPVSKMYFSNGYSIIYSDRNEYRLPNYFRWDISLTYKGGLRKKRYNSSWSLSVYNLTARKNVYSVYYKIDGENIQGYQLSVIGSAIPTLTYKFSF